MKQATIRLYTPADLSGRLIAWRLESDFCHATIELDELIYSATVPDITSLALDNPDVAQPPRGGEAHVIDLSDDEHAKALAYCRSMLGSSYDLLAIAGWAFRIEAMQRPQHVYCFEYVYDALAAAGLFPASKRLVTGDQLLVDLSRIGRIEAADATHARAAQQPLPVSVKAPAL